MKAAELPALLQDFYRDKLTALMRHQATARLIGQYDVNNAYQYVVNREELQVTWIARALADLDLAAPSVNDADRSVSGKGAEAAASAIREDAADAQAFLDRWQPKLDHVVNVRVRNMMRIVLGEVLEQKRLFEQAAAGRSDLIGRRAAQPEPAKGTVLATRWVGE